MENSSEKTLSDVLLEDGMKKVMSDDELKKILLNDDIKAVLEDTLKRHKDSKKFYKRMIKMIREEEKERSNLFYNSKTFLDISDKFLYERAKDRIYAFTLTKGKIKKTLALAAAGTLACALFFALQQNNYSIRDSIPKQLISRQVYALSEKPRNYMEKQDAGSETAVKAGYASLSAPKKPLASFSSITPSTQITSAISIRPSSVSVNSSSPNPANFSSAENQAEISYAPNSSDSDYIYFIVRNDTLSKISMQITGSADYWMDLMRHNNLSSTLIEVNQPLKIPSHLAYNKTLLSNARLVSDSECAGEKFDGTKISNKYVIAEKGDEFSSLSEKAFGRRDLGDIILDYNKEINPRFSSTIYDREYIFIPPDNYKSGMNG